uniref:Uncharacterized protein n=1 Tax=Cacopsylla melanoneura TaxID=428564 RepID=A0A8D8TEG6_9HEMI
MFLLYLLCALSSVLPSCLYCCQYQYRLMLTPCSSRTSGVQYCRINRPSSLHLSSNLLPSSTFNLSQYLFMNSLCALNRTLRSVLLSSLYCFQYCLILSLCSLIIPVLPSAFACLQYFFISWLCFCFISCVHFVERLFNLTSPVNSELLLVLLPISS